MLAVLAVPAGIFDLLQALDIVARRDEVRLNLAGRFLPPTNEQQLSESAGWQQVDFVGWQNRTQIAQILSRSRLGVVPLHALPRFVDSQPVKLYEYMAAGISRGGVRLSTLARDNHQAPMWATL